MTSPDSPVQTAAGAASPATPDRPGLPASALDSAGGAIGTEIATSLTNALSRLEPETYVPLQQAIRAAARAHRRLQEGPLFTTPPTDHALWQEVDAYQHAADKAVIVALHDAIAAHEPAMRIADAWTGLFESWTSLGADMPELATVPEADALYDSGPADSAWRRVRKALRRFRRRTQRTMHAVANLGRHLVRRAPRDFAPFSRVVPVSELLRYHVQVRLSRLGLPLHDQMQEAVGERLAVLERAVTNWADEILALSQELDRARYHYPEGLVPPPLESGEDEAKSEKEKKSDQDTDPDPLNRVRTIAGAFQAALEEAAGPLVVPSIDRTALSNADGEFRADLATAGTFLLPSGRRQLKADASPPAAVMETRRSAWVQWHQELRNRLDLVEQLIQLRDRLHETVDALLARAGAATVGPINEAFAKLKTTFDRAQAEAAAACDTQSPRSLAGMLEELHQRLIRTFQQVFGDLPGIVASDQALAEPGAPEWKSLQEMAQQMPEKALVHPLDRVEPGGRSLTMNLRAIVSEALNPPWPVQLKGAAEPLRQRVLHVWSESEQLQHIVQYNFQEAVDGLQRATGQVVPDPQPGEDSASSPTMAVDQARQLVSDALRRSIDTMDDLAATLHEPWRGFGEAVFETYRSDWRDLHRRVQAEDVMEERWVGIRTRLTRTWERAWHRTTASAEAAFKRGRVLAIAGVALGKRLVRRGRQAVGVVDTGEIDLLSALDVIAGVDDLIHSLPLVYRRLFTLRPLSEASLMEGRARGLVKVRNHFEHWREGKYPGALIVAAPLGSGRTSFLQVLQEKVFGDADVRQIQLTKRFTDEAAFAGLLARLLELPASIHNFDELDAALQGQRPAKTPIVLMADGIEHLMLQQPGGSELIERALVFFSRADVRLFWIATVGSDAWSFIKKTASGAASCVTEYSLTPIDRATTEAIVINRHRRSGLSLKFAAPAEPSALLKQRLRRARSEAKQQELLRGLYFDKLSRISGQSIMLALFYWLRSASFDDDGDTLTVHPLDSIDFGVLATLDLTQAFTLKAFYIHCTLTVEEHDRVFRMTTQQSMYVFESLLNVRIIEPVRSDDLGDLEDNVLNLGARYRIRPLLLHPVAELLRRKNILY